MEGKNQLNIIIIIILVTFILIDIASDERPPLNE